MRIIFSMAVLFAAVAFNACTPDRGCTEATADNFDVNAKYDDGTCIPSRDKMIGNYTYTSIWRDTILQGEYMDMGTIQCSEANTANNAFNFFLNGNFVLQGSVSQSTITMETHVVEEEYMGFPFVRTYNGSGFWLENDTVDMYFEMVTQVPVVLGNPPQLTTLPQIYRYYCTKAN